jgi:hypothetical protein
VTGIPDMVLASSLDIGVVGKVRSVNPGFRVRGERVCYQIAQARMEYEDGRVWPDKQVGVGAVGLERCFGTDDDS